METIFFDTMARIINLLDLELVEVGRTHADSAWTYTSVCSPFNRLYFIQSGKGWVVCGGQETELLPGQIYLIPADATCDYHCPDSLDKIYFHFNLLLPNGSDLFSSYKTLFSFPCSSEETNYLLSLLWDGSLSDAFLLKQALWKHLRPFLDRTKDNISLRACKPYSPLVDSALKTVHGQLSATLKVSDVAAALHVPTERLSYIFKKELGVSLKEYTAHMLFLRAKQLLVSTSRSVKEIAFELQFSDPFYFSNFFKNRAGVSPTAYRKIYTFNDNF